MSLRKLSTDEIETALGELKNWKVEGKLLKKRYEFANFQKALDFVNQVGEIAEVADHHPDICFGWGYVKVELTTHDTGGLTRNDFDIAAEISGLRIGISE